MTPIDFVNDKGDGIISVRSGTVPHIGEKVNIPTSHFDESASQYARTSYRVTDVEYPVVKGPNGTYLQVFVTLVPEHA